MKDSSIVYSNSLFDDFDLSHLKHFYVIATHGGFTRASRATGASQPALSLGLQKLEKFLNVRLIGRNSRNFALTQEGMKLLDFCQRLENNFDSMRKDLEGSKKASPRRLRIGTALSIGLGPLVQGCISELKTETPMELDLSMQNTFHLISELHAGNIDAALLPDDVSDSGLVFHKIRAAQIAMISGKIFRNELRKNTWKQTLRTTPLITYPRETPMRSLVDAYCSQHGIKFKTVLSVNSTDSIKALVSEGAGVAFVLKFLIGTEKKQKDIIELEPPFPLPKTGIAVATRAGEYGEMISELVSKWVQL